MPVEPLCPAGAHLDPALGTCRHEPRPDGAACSDGNVCTVGDRCVAGVCTPVSYGQCD